MQITVQTRPEERVFGAVLLVHAEKSTVAVES
jgi:hypothetical protein